MGTEQDEAAKKAAEEKAKQEQEAAAAKAAKVAQVTAQITGLQGKIKTADEFISQLDQVKGKLTTAKTNLGLAYSRCYGNEIVTKVVVKNKFEGNSAEWISKLLPAAIKRMQENKEGIGTTIESIGTQVEKLNMYKASLNSKITELRNSI